MSQPPFEWPQSYLDEVRRVFEPRYGEKLSDERVLNIAKTLSEYTRICYDSCRKRIIKEEDEIRTGKSTEIKAIPHIEQNQGKPEKKQRVRVEPKKLAS